jgi:hypothetical protein
MTRGEGAPARVGQQAAGSTGGALVESDATEDRTDADPDVWRDRAEQARAHAGRLRDPNIQTALLSIAKGLDRLGLRAQDARRTEPPLAAPQSDGVSETGTTDRVDAAPATFDLNDELGPKAQPAAAAQPGGAMTDMGDRVQPKLHDTARADMSLADTFRAMEALGPKPPPPATGVSDRIERVARALCHADGRDPDRVIETGQWETVVSGDLQTRRPVVLRGWKVYEKDARQFLAAFAAALVPTFHCEFGPVDRVRPAVDETVGRACCALE